MYTRRTARGGWSRPLNPQEWSFWLTDRVGTINCIVAARLRGELEIGTVERALARLQQRYALLRCRIEPGRPPRFVQTAAPIPLRVIPWRSGGDYEEAIVEMNRPFDWRHGPLMRACLLRQDDRTDVVLCYHHSAGDGEAGLFALRYLLEQLGAASVGSAAPTSEPVRPEDDDIFTRRPGSGWRALRNMGRLWGSMIQRAPDLLPAEREVAPAQRVTRMLSHTLAEDETAAFLARCKARGIKAHGALCAAFMQAIAAELRSQGQAGPFKLGCYSAVSLRNLVKPAVGDAFGNCVTSDVSFHQTDARYPFWELAQEIGLATAELQRRAPDTMRLYRPFIPWRDDPEGYIRTMERWPFIGVTTSNLGRLDLPPEYGALRLDHVWLAVGINAIFRTAPLVVSSTFAGRMHINVLFAEPLLEQARAERLLEAAMPRLLGDHPGTG